MSSADLALPRATSIDRPMRYRGTLARQYVNEVALVFRRKRNIAMLLILAVVPILIGTAVKLSSPRPGQGPPLIGQLTDNGLFLAFAALTICLPVFLPLAVAVVAGDSVAGEANSGTLRYLLTVPVSRTRVLVVKSLGVLTYTLGAILLVAVVGMVFGVAIFGTHGVTLLSGDTVSFANGLARAAGVSGYVFVDLLGLAAIAVFFSTLTEVPVGAMAATVVVAIVFAVLDSVPQLGSLRPLLLTHNWLNYDELLRSTVASRTLLHGLVVPLSYTAIFGSLAWARISNADVTA
jgi:ABC-2 type transport system permease protein